MSDAIAALVLEDGTVFEGRPYGAAGRAPGLAVFYTGVVGYQEVLTDPSYRGTILVLTFPIAGAYGVNAEDNQSPALHPAGVVVREASRTHSNWRSNGSLEDLLKARGIVGVREVDTRAVAVHLRDKGEMRGAVVSGEFDAAAVARDLKAPPPARDLVGEATWEEVRPARGPETCRLVVLNLGATESLLGQLAALGARVEVLRADTPAKDVLKGKPRGVVVAGGPGDPGALEGPIETVRALLGRVPLLGIGLGHQVLALALGCRIERMKAGHRGVNYPVLDRPSGTSRITAQGHGFVVSAEGLAPSAEVTHTNLNDGTVEGVRAREAAAWGLQFHPQPDDFGRPSDLLRAFIAGQK
jgi:carbamoyl-phosphate synthase small subunit